MTVDVGQETDHVRSDHNLQGNIDEEQQGFAHDGPATASCSMQEPAVQGRSATLLRVKDSNITVSLVEF